MSFLISKKCLSVAFLAGSYLFVGTAHAFDLACEQQTEKYLYDKTSMSSSQSRNGAKNYCRTGASFNCLEKKADELYYSTSMNRDQSTEKAILFCTEEMNDRDDRHDRDDRGGGRDDRDDRRGGGSWNPAPQPQPQPRPEPRPMPQPVPQPQPPAPAPVADGTRCAGTFTIRSLSQDYTAVMVVNAVGGDRLEGVITQISTQPGVDMRLSDGVCTINGRGVALATILGGEAPNQGSITYNVIGNDINGTINPLSGFESFTGSK